MIDDEPTEDEVRDALARHGYDPDASPSGVSGPPRTWLGTRVVSRDPWRTEPVTLRPHVCQLDGVEIDGHEVSDLDPNGGCVHCYPHSGPPPAGGGATPSPTL